MHPWVTNRSGAQHCIRERPLGRLIIPRADRILPQRHQEPARCVPPLTRLGDKVERFHEVVEGAPIAPGEQPPLTFCSFLLEGRKCLGRKSSNLTPLRGYDVSSATLTHSSAVVQHCG